MNELKIIKSQEVLGKEFRIYGDYENPLFLAKDVAEWIDYGKNTGELLLSVDNDEKLTTKISYSGQNREMWFVTEDGLYEILMQSRKPIANAFKKQVKVILKDVRKHGLYATDELLANPDLFIEVLQKLKASREKIAIQSQQIVEMKPKASYYDVVLNCKDLVAISTISKDYGMSATKLNQILKNKKVQYKQGSIWLLYQKYAEQGYTSTKVNPYNGNDGTIHTKPHTYWTQKGRLFIYGLLKNDGILPVIEREFTNEYK